MSKTNRPNHRRAERELHRRPGTTRPSRERHITVRGVRRKQPDLRKLSRAVIALAMAEMEAEKAAAEQAAADDANAADAASDTVEQLKAALPPLTAGPAATVSADLDADPAADRSEASHDA